MLTYFLAFVITNDTKPVLNYDVQPPKLFRFVLSLWLG